MRWIFCCEKLGIAHFDFIIATHGHSDHIGGMPYIADYISNDSSKPLVDNNTVYIYKEYKHINEIEDDLSVVSNQSEDPIKWHNQAFVYNAVSAMKRRGVKAIDISMGLTTSNLCSANDYQSLLEAMQIVGLDGLRIQNRATDSVSHS